MTIRGKHLQCDMRDNCISCSIYTFPPELPEPKTYYYCEHCKIDILCDRGFSTSYIYYDDGYVEEKTRCIKCQRLLMKKTWPIIPTRLKKELLNL